MLAEEECFLHESRTFPDNLSLRGRYCQPVIQRKEIPKMLELILFVLSSLDLPVPHKP
jgi:hypothetical protein